MEATTKVMYRNIKRNGKTKASAISISRKDCNELGMTDAPLYVKVTIEPVPKEHMPSQEAATETVAEPTGDPSATV